MPKYVFQRAVRSRVLEKGQPIDIPDGSIAVSASIGRDGEEVISWLQPAPPEPVQ